MNNTKQKLDASLACLSAMVFLASCRCENAAMEGHQDKQAHSPALQKMESAAASEQHREPGVDANPVFTPAEREILGEIPKGEPEPGFPVRVLVTSGGDLHTVYELVHMAVTHVFEVEGPIPTNRFRIYVTIPADDTNMLAKVLVSQGIGRSNWDVTIGRNMKIVGFKKGFGRDLIGEPK